MKYQSFVGLEIHIQLITETKVFCSCPNNFGDEPNTNVCPVCMGYPGALPSLNEEAVFKALKVSRALNCHINEKAVFERKNYFYPDMPKNYQISQFEFPFGINGYFDLELDDGSVKRIRIHDVHLEEDAGKMIHDAYQSRLDYNRAGTPLLEIVTEPDLLDGREAELFVQQFRQLVRYLEVTDGNMEEGSLRCDANTSINLPGKGLGTKTEVKNLNSSRFVNKALTYEIKRHAKVLDKGDSIVQETRLWDEGSSTTRSMRSKEDSHDYRYFPEPDLPPFRPGAALMARVEEAMIELPNERKKRYEAELNLTADQAAFITAEKNTADWFEAVLAAGADASQAAGWLSGDIQKVLNKEGAAIDQSPFTPERIKELFDLINSNRISNNIGKDVLQAVFDEDKDPSVIVKEKGLEQVSDTGAVEKVVEEVLAAHPAVVDAIRAGEDKQIGFLMGQLMKATGGKVNPQLAREMIENKIKGSE
ncbi:Asp-tRNA(Asn)/Glu-tRNA(Gln) amidotransferase subunit GatB [Spirochaeta isovalerica]|uniref:Aspartyl/glutamyl-tRNA(Asn/Gln) amidotransferase subunit B n=1 Tax=Spirochaeta isovalerica TaxID=150 RepID=A0A841R995_9SPIO|nr:Asp-tRNA(Asn)/Glu-tRNA(Gln) amidotransferase subunit GatB [Spirochaeta isovalerica]MBB6480473.1 aspartyl-tRNA(Asn)/glutamyl-tRNA(Gln) amidotransferase subunit B [Spirochaeta isovalerica]